MEKEVVGPSGQQFQRDSTTVVGQRLAMGQRVRDNASVQTDEEFSLELLQDCATSRGVANIPITDQVKLERGKLNDNQNGHAGYEEFTSISGLRRKDSDCNHDSSDVALRKGYTVKVENRSNSHNVSPYYENGDDIKELKKSFREMNDYQAVSRTSTPHIPVLDTHDSVPFGSRTSNSSRLGKIKLLCSFGGKILPRPSDGKLRYVGGETRIISIRKNLSWIELVKKTSEICKQPHTIKYQLPGEGLDALISVSCDEDLQNMLEEYQGIEKVDGQKLRLFLISKNESETASFETMVSEHCGSEYQYVVAINGISDRSPRKSSGDTLGQNLDGTYSTSLHLKDFKDAVSPCEVLFQNWIPIRESDKPHVIVRNNSDLDSYSCERPIVKERRFHSEMLLSQVENPTNLLAGSSDSLASHHGMPHALQEHGEKANHCSQEGITSSSPLDFSNTISPAWINSIAWQKESIRAPEIQNKLPNNKSTTMPKTIDLPKFSHILENSVKAEYIHIGTHDLAGKSQTTNEVSNLISLDHSPKVLELMPKNDSFLPHSEEHHVNDTISTFSNIKENTISVHGVYSDSKMTHVSRTATSVSLSALDEKAEGYQLGLMIYEPLVKDQRTSEVGDVNKIPSCDAKFCDGESSCTNPYCGSSLGISCPSSFALDVASQKEKHDQESRLISTVRSDALAVEDTSHQRLNLCMMKDSFSCSSSHQENVDASLKRDALQLDDLFVNYPNKNDNQVDPWGYPHKSADLEHHTFVSPEQVHNFGGEVQPESVIIEEATDSMLQHIESSSKVVAHVQDKDLLPRLTDSNAEGEVDHRDNKDESISDAAVKIDASAYDLQIIRNADLEELRELGSGAFGTVYHGKWRGTDVAIKRIKKSCFSGRSSEKMRLTNDFWREAHILSKLHHPNIVAFYGVVPDGSGGTLATVTEFMVNGSLRHVLSKKDRTLDRSKKLMIAMDAAFGMEYLHLKNIVHFDLKCDNLLVNLRDPQRPVCKVADFGLSKIKRNTLVSGGVRGTLPWMAPELLNAGSIQVSEKVDVFSFGIAMWEILTGEEPYANMHCGAIIGGIMNNTLRPTIPDRCDPEWRKLMEQCWAAEPSVRPSFTAITNRLRNMSMALQTIGCTK